jgi:hypothetical protein
MRNQAEMALDKLSNSSMEVLEALTAAAQKDPGSRLLWRTFVVENDVADKSRYVGPANILSISAF